MGENGAGKSTTIKMLTGLLTPTSGKVIVNGKVPYENRIENNNNYSRGGNTMKKLLFLFFCFIIMIEPVLADDNLRFYNTKEKVDGMWITRIDGDKSDYNSPFVLRRKSDSSYVYCLEPIVPLNQTEDYLAYDTNKEVLNISDEDFERISNLAYFGYLYPGHEDIKWYGITQYLIWKTAAKNMTIYFADGKKGKKIEPYQKEIEEIESLIDNYQELKNGPKKLIFKNRKEWNQWIHNNIVLKNAIMPLQDAYSFELPSNETALETGLFYYHKSGQNVYHPGLLTPMNFSFEVEFLKGRISLKKKNIENVFISNKNTLKGATYGIYQDGVLVEEIKTDEKGEATSSLLEYGIYVVKEKEASEGYLVDENSYTISVDKENIFLEVYEEQEEKDITIEKWYGSGTYKLESDAIFEIYQEEKLVMTVTTDENGIAKFKLPKGDYILHQVKGKEGYQNIKDLSFTIDDKFEGILKLYNKEIIPDVPDTGRIYPLGWMSFINSIWRKVFVY